MSLALEVPRCRPASWSSRLVALLSGAVLTAAAGVAQNSSGKSSEVTADALVQQHRYAEAMDRYEASLAADPRNSQARHGELSAATAWAAAEAEQQHGEQAMVILERALRQLPQEPTLLVSFGLEAITLGRLDIARQALDAAAKLQPNSPPTLYALARLEVEEQHLPEAERHLKEYLALQPKDASAYFGLGHIYEMEQQFAEARAAYGRSLALQPRQTESYYELGQIALEGQQDTEAQQMFTKVLARAPHHAGALTGMGQIALHAKQYDRAEHFLAAAEQSDPNYPTPHYFRGLALAKLGRTEEARQELLRGDSRPHAAGAESGQTSGNRSSPAAPAPH